MCHADYYYIFIPDSWEFYVEIYFNETYNFGNNIHQGVNVRHN
jgi:hypothetical protein